MNLRATHAGESEVSRVLDELGHIKFVALRAVFEAQDVLSLPVYKGGMFRGVFGRALRSESCSRRQGECSSCLVAAACPYHYIFETAVSPEIGRMRKYPFAPHPFVLEPAGELRTDYLPKENFDVCLVLIGKGADFLPYVAAALRAAGERYGLGRSRGKARLLRLSQVLHGGPDFFPADVWEQGRRLSPGASDPRVSSQGAAGNELVLWQAGNSEFSCRAVLQSIRHLFGEGVTAGAAATREASWQVRLSFQTPCRVANAGKLTDQVDFHVVFRALLRRLSNLAVFHCGHALNLDFRELVRRSLLVNTTRSDVVWRDWERYSARQNTRMKMGGVVGEVEYAPVPSGLLPFLKLGEVLHVGNGTSMGLGKYTLEARPS